MDHPDKDEYYYWPLDKKFAFMYKMWMLVHCVFILVFCVGRVAFEEKPRYYVVLSEFYLDLVYLVDMARLMTLPFTTSTG